MEAEKRKGTQHVVPQEKDGQWLTGIADCDIVATGSGLLSLPHSQDDDNLNAKYDILVVADLIEVIIIPSLSSVVAPSLLIIVCITRPPTFYRVPLGLLGREHWLTSCLL